MTTLREAATQALEALEAGPDVDPIFAGETEAALRAALAEDALQRFTDVNQELEAALAEPVQEPVAWIQPDHLQKARRAPFLCRVEPTKRMVDFVPLYTAPPQRKPLTKESLLHIYNQLPNWGMDMDRLPQGLEKFARAIERAHGIT